MAAARESDLLLARTHPLPDGGRARLRLARTRDAEGIGALLERCGHRADELEVGALVRFDPRKLFVVCATRLIEGREVIVGVGAIELGEESTGEPQLLAVDHDLDGALRDLLRGALVSRAI